MRLDGVLLVRGMSMDGARVIVVSADREPKVITDALDHFTLDLDLQAEYLISFERPGCVSKELRFSTLVPEDHLGTGSFFFPFQVTLFAPGNGRHYEYAGPVGYIHFVKEINAFGYDTDYRVAKDESLSKRLDLVRKTLGMLAVGGAVQVGGAEPDISPLPAGKDMQRGGDGGTSRFATMAPIASEVAPMVHVLKARDNEPLPATIKEQAISPKEGMEGGQPGEHQEARPPLAWMDESGGPVEGNDFSRELEMGKLHLTTIVKVRRGVQEVEYRRVVSYYGGVTYFCNGLPCSETTYNLGVAR